MRQIKKLTSILMLLFVSLFVGCNEEDPPFLQVSETNITTDKEMKEIPIKVISNSFWTAETPASDWCKLSLRTGANDTHIGVVLLENTGKVNRSSVITIKAGEDNPKVVTIHLTQSGTDEWDSEEKE